MGKTAWHGYMYSLTSVVVFGMFGNILVIIFILRQRKLLENNYYFLVLHLAICDLGCCAIIFMAIIYRFFVGAFSVTYCLAVVRIDHIFVVAGIYMMMVIAVLRYRATVYPLKPATSRRKMKIACGLGYILGLILGYGAAIPLCIMKQNYVMTVYKKYFHGYSVFCFYLLPLVFMIVIYIKLVEPSSNKTNA